jgi:hypothetical protein
MPTPELIERVKSLRGELGALQPDPAKATAVDELQQRLDAVLREPAHLPHYTSLSDRLLLHYVGFQIDHPKLATTMESLANALSGVS